jgi:hypothetical protein
VTSVASLPTTKVPIVTHERALGSDGRPLPSVPNQGFPAIVSDMKLKGTISRTDVEGGHWLLETDDGDRYQLVGAVDGCEDGQKVEVEGKVDKQAMGIGMMGAHFNVTKITAL